MSNRIENPQNTLPSRGLFFLPQVTSSKQAQSLKQRCLEHHHFKLFTVVKEGDIQTCQSLRPLIKLSLTPISFTLRECSTRSILFSCIKYPVLILLIKNPEIKFNARYCGWSIILPEVGNYCEIIIKDSLNTRQSMQIWHMNNKGTIELQTAKYIIIMIFKAIS